MEKQIKSILEKVVHPEKGESLASAGMLRGINIDPDEKTIVINIGFNKTRDPFEKSVSREINTLLSQSYPDWRVLIDIARPEKKEAGPKHVGQKSGMAGVKKIVAVASGKGGVGKSTMSSNLAVTLSQMGYKTGLLDADIYGPSQPKMFGVEQFRPEMDADTELMTPATAHGVKVMSIGFFINPADALVWRGPMATSALRQLIHQTDWGELDYLLIDLPPGTGDVHLTVLQQIKIDGAVIVSTPQQVALADVVRGIGMFRSENVDIPVIGIIENMAWFTPAELPENRYYLFGKGGACALAAETGIELLGEIPIVQSVMESAENGHPYSLNKNAEKFYRHVAEKIVDKLNKQC